MWNLGLVCLAIGFGLMIFGGVCIVDCFFSSIDDWLEKEKKSYKMDCKCPTCQRLSGIRDDKALGNS